MRPRLSPDRAFAISFAFARTAFCAYRAATQSFTSDEAFSYNEFISGDWSRLYDSFSANNHLLYSILAKLSIGAFGASEFALRLPSVLSGFFFVLGVYYLLREAGCSRAVTWMAMIGLSLHPLLLDFSVAARGYGLSMALFVWAIYFLLRGRDIFAGALAGLAISANLTLLYPAVGLILCPLLLRKDGFENRIQGFLRLTFTLLAVFGAVYYESLSQATLTNFYVGTTTIRDSVLNLIVSSIFDRVWRGIFGSFDAAHMIEFAALPAIMLFACVKSLPYPRNIKLAPLTILLVALTELIAAHYILGLRYPIDRLGLYLIVLFALAWAVALSSTGNPWIRGVNGAIAGLIVLQFATQLQARWFQVWEYDDATKQMALRIENETRDKPPDSVKIGATWWQQPALEFYRKVYRIAALQPVKRYETTPLEGFDYYVLDLRSDPTIRNRNVKRLRPLLSEPAADVLLAKEP
ncbi:MAG TPA: hypothetical protein VH639_13035 [Bryobacteraceae bacterium]